MGSFHYNYANIGRQYVFLILMSGSIIQYMSSPWLSMRKEKQFFSVTEARFLSNNHSIRSNQRRKKKKKHSKLLAVANKCFITAGDASGSENMMHRAAVSTHLAVRYVLHPRPGVKYGFMCSCEHVITYVSLLLARRSDVCNIHGQHVTAVSGCYCLYRRTQSESTANLVNLLQISKCCQCLILIIDCTSILNMRSITMFQPFTQQPLSNLRLNNSLFTF